MRLIHELHCTVGGGSLHPYAQPIHEAGRLPTSGYALLIISPEDAHHEEDEILIDGDLRVVHRALTDALHVLEMLAQDAVERGTLDPEWKRELT